MLRFCQDKRRSLVSSCGALKSTVGPLVFVVAVGGGATASPSNPFGIPEEEFRTKGKRIALAPIAVPPRLGGPEPAKLRVDALIETKLREADRKSTRLNSSHSQI